MLIEKLRTGTEALFQGDGDSFYREFAPTTQHTLVFDPPWDIATRFDVRNSDNILAFCDGYRAGDIITMLGPPTWIFVWDCVTSWYTPNRPLKRVKLCLWYGSIEDYNCNGYKIESEARKNRIVKNSRGSYLFTPQHGKYLSDLYQYPITKLHSGSAHRHSKPIEWVTALIGNVLRPGDAVIDPFAGSGSSLIAARTLGVNWIGCDIDPAAINQIIAATTAHQPRIPVQQEIKYD